MRRYKLGNSSKLAGLLMSLGASSLGCASQRTAVPTERIAQSEVSIRAAEQAGANTTNPSAALELRHAQAEQEAARRLIADNKNQEADLMLIRAAVDADLARALADATTSRAEARKAQDEARMARRQSMGSQGTGMSPNNDQGSPPTPDSPHTQPTQPRDDQ